MDGYGFKLNELKDDMKLKNDNYDTWERLITLYLFAAGAHEIIFGVDGFPPLTRPQINAAEGTPLHKGQKDTLDKWNRGNQAGIQTISLNSDVGHSAAQREECQRTLVLKQSIAQEEHQGSERIGQNEVDGF